MSITIDPPRTIDIVTQLIRYAVAYNSTQTACGVPPAQHHNFMQWFRAVFFALPSFFVAVRVVNKSLKLSTWGWDDTTIMVAYVRSHSPYRYLPPPDQHTDSPCCFLAGILP